MKKINSINPVNSVAIPSRENINQAGNSDLLTTKPLRKPPTKKNIKIEYFKSVQEDPSKPLNFSNDPIPLSLPKFFDNKSNLINEGEIPADISPIKISSSQQIIANKDIFFDFEDYLSNANAMSPKEGIENKSFLNSTIFNGIFENKINDKRLFQDRDSEKKTDIAHPTQKFLKKGP